MNPLLQEWLASRIRQGLSILSGFLIARGLLTDDLGGRMIEAAVPFLISLIWSLWATYGKRLKLVTALSQGRAMSETTLEKIIANPNIVNPSATTPKDAVPSVGEWTIAKGDHK